MIWTSSRTSFDADDRYGVAGDVAAMAATPIKDQPAARFGAGTTANAASPPVLFNRTSACAQTLAGAYSGAVTAFDYLPAHPALQESAPTSAAQLLEYVKTKLGFTWEEWADVMRVDVRSIHLWRSGATPRADKQQRLEGLWQFAKWLPATPTGVEKEVMYRWLVARGNPLLLIGKDRGNLIDYMQTRTPYTEVIHEGKWVGQPVPDTRPARRSRPPVADLRRAPIRERILGPPAQIVDERRVRMSPPKDE